MNCDINVYFNRIDILVILLWFCSSSHLFVSFPIFYNLNKYSLDAFLLPLSCTDLFLLLKYVGIFFPTENLMLPAVLFQLRVF